MQSSATVVLERRTPLTSGLLETFPYEAGWADEAVFFIQAPDDHPDLALTVQFSADGINWVDESTVGVLSAGQSNTALKVGHFGNFIRLIIDAGTPLPGCEVLIHLVLKG